MEFYQNRQYQIYRDATKGWRKDCLKGSVQWEKGSNYINFSDSKQLKEEYQIINRSDYSTNSLAERALDLYQHWNFNGKNIEDIIQEVEKITYKIFIYAFSSSYFSFVFLGWLLGCGTTKMG